MLVVGGQADLLTEPQHGEFARERARDERRSPRGPGSPVTGRYREAVAEHAGEQAGDHGDPAEPDVRTEERARLRVDDLGGARADLLEHRARGELTPDQAAGEAEHRAARERPDDPRDGRADRRPLQDLHFWHLRYLGHHCHSGHPTSLSSGDRTRFENRSAGQSTAAGHTSEVTVSAGTVILLILVLVVIAVVAAAASMLLHRRPAQRRLGAEFSRLVRETGPWRARAEFAERRRRVGKLGIKPLSGERRAGYARQWTAAQERFIDSPPQATTTAAALVTAGAAERGYDVSDGDRLLIDLSVYHGRYLDGYRRATRTTARAETAATEELRQALLDHRGLFQDLLDASPDP